tara:strand:+ start:376 stop:660 length:285 start_codon:yes stop_codon:yes gene_type:complete
MKSLEEKPVKQVLVTMHLMSYLFALACIAATVSWIYYIAKAVENDLIGGSDGLGPNGTAVAGAEVTTADAMFEGTVIAAILYLVFRHHFSNSHA